MRAPNGETAWKVFRVEGSVRTREERERKKRRTDKTTKGKKCFVGAVRNLLWKVAKPSAALGRVASPRR